MATESETSKGRFKFELLLVWWGLIGFPAAGQTMMIQAKTKRVRSANQIEIIHS